MFQCNNWIRLESWVHLEKSKQTYFWHYLPVADFLYTIKVNTHKNKVYDLVYQSWLNLDTHGGEKLQKQELLKTVKNGQEFK